MDKRLLLASPHMSGEGYELEYINDAFRKNWIAPLGENVNEFEKAMGTYMGKGYPVALSAGTAALHLAMILAGVKRGDAVFCQSLTFSASANPVVYCGAKPVFIDSERETWNMDPAALRRAFELYGVPKAVVAVHLYGNPAKLDEIIAICREHNVPLIEDAAEALGSTYNGQKCGTFGDFGALSFNGNKIITTSGGGMLLCQTEEEAKHALKLATQARVVPARGDRLQLPHEQHLRRYRPRPDEGAATARGAEAGYLCTLLRKPERPAADHAAEAGLRGIEPLAVCCPAGRGLRRDARRDAGKAERGWH